jgi:ABC-type nitrate/sulfonate/bicarbonate transport system ATPase subunit
MTPRPGQVREILEVDVPRPRALEVLTSAPFSALKARILSLIYDQPGQREEVARVA